ncbi:DUF397 domain-containing protein [Streptomyces sp. SPB162]|uniref:DUF397 domain-containing protein n=1 Tax=Streptomyces sp. SPB162 TaxID=2940560 RepID=UPI0024067F8F|nr:DUF397 domain-containing protein [Streptomyces sp. SPB162]MDF9813756.1 hypothetical protein [Streptomyces sp. SPB162]
MPPITHWQKSSFSAGGDGNNCVELAKIGRTVRLRESDAPGVVLTTTPALLASFVDDVKAGRYDHFAG